MLNTFPYHYLVTMILWKMLKVTAFIYLSKIFWKALVVAIPFLSFKETTHTYFLKLSITHNSKPILLLDLLVNYISARSALQILSIEDECTFCLSDFLMIGSCTSSANCRVRSGNLATRTKSKGRWFNIISYLAPLTQDFLSKNL